MKFIISKGMLFIFIITILGSVLTYRILVKSYDNWFAAQAAIYETK